MTCLDANQLEAIKAQLVRRAMSGQHLANWLPGGDHKAAVSALVTQHGGGSLVVNGIEDCLYSQTHSKGIGAYEDFGDAMRDKNRLAWLTWQEVIDMLSAGVSPHRLAELKRTGADWVQWHHNDRLAESRGKESVDERQRRIQTRIETYEAVDRPYNEAIKSIIEAAIDAQSPELTLF